MTARDLLRNLPNQGEYSTIPTHQDMLVKLRDWLPSTMATIQTDWNKLSRVSTEIMWHIAQEVSRDLNTPKVPPLADYRRHPIGCRSLSLFILDNAFLDEVQANELAAKQHRQGPNGKLLRVMPGSVIARAADVVGKFAKNSTLEVVEDIEPFEIVRPGSEPASSQFSLLMNSVEQDAIRERRRLAGKNRSYATASL